MTLDDNVKMFNPTVQLLKPLQPTVTEKLKDANLKLRENKKTEDGDNYVSNNTKRTQKKDWIETSKCGTCEEDKEKEKWKEI